MRFGLLAVPFVAAACLTTPKDACHERLIAQYGCCPFHGDECDAPQDAIAQACEGIDASHDPALLVEDDDEDDEKPGRDVG